MWFACFTVFAVHKNCFHVLSNVDQNFVEFFCKFFDLYKEYNSCLNLFLSFLELFPAFNCAQEIGNLLSIWFGVSIVSSFPFCCLFCSANSSLSKLGISVVSSCSSDFRSAMSDFFLLLFDLRSTYPLSINLYHLSSPVKISSTIKEYLVP